MESFLDLQIYHESRRIGVAIHAMSLALPKFELYEEGSQIRRSSKAVTTMIVEGFARRRYKADYIKHLVYAVAECDETLVHLDYLFDTQSLKDKEQYDTLRDRIVQVSKKINKYTTWIEDHFEWKPNRKDGKKPQA